MRVVDLEWDCSSGVSESAVSIEREIQDIQEGLIALYALRAFGMIDHFLSLPYKHMQEDWDGFGAVPLSERSYGRAFDFLAWLIFHYNTHVESIPLVFVNPHGEVCLEWFKSKRNKMTITFADDGIDYMMAVRQGIPSLYGLSRKIDLIRETVRLLAC